jgi:hypothetical protein
MACKYSYSSRVLDLFVGYYVLRYMISTEFVGAPSRVGQMSSHLR